MSQSKNRDDGLKLAHKNFAYLIAKDFQVVDVDVPGKRSWPVVFESKCRIRVDW